MRSAVLSSFFLLTCALAQQPTCPNGQSGAGFGGVYACCPGSINMDSSTVVCITGCTITPPACFPFCSDSASDTATTSGVCTSSTVTLSSGVATATTYVTTIFFTANTPTTTSTSSTPVTSNGPSPTTTSTSQSSNAAPGPTAAPLLLLGAMAMALV